MLVSIHQPHYLPWLRYFEKIARSDVFILLDDVQYEKNGFQNRNKIKTAQGWSYLTVPVRRPTQRCIRDIELVDDGWREKHRRAIEMNYRRAPFFAKYWPELEAIYRHEWANLGELNAGMLTVFLHQLEIGTRVERSSALSVQGQSSERLVDLCRAVAADAYLSGAYALEQYLDPEAFRSAGIRLVLQEWKAPAYNQLYAAAGFIPDLAIVDLLFNEGPRARAILTDSGRVIYQ